MDKRCENCRYSRIKRKQLYCLNYGTKHFKVKAEFKCPQWQPKEQKKDE